MAEPALRLCADAGLSFETTERSLVVPCANAPVDLLLVRPSDIPEYVQDGVVDLGITGANLVVEARGGRRRRWPSSASRAARSRPPSRTTRRSASSTISTACASRPPIPSSTERLLDERGVRCELVPVSGSVEATPRLGLADAIVDLVSTGSTMDANGLRLIGTLLASQAVLIGGRAAIEERRDLVERLELMLSGVVAARRTALRDDERARSTTLPAIRAVLPEHGRADRAPAGGRGRRSPCTRRSTPSEIWSLLPRLKDAGATSILVLPVERLVP